MDANGQSQGYVRHLKTANNSVHTALSVRKTTK
jgi:hypothetical protein